MKKLPTLFDIVSNKDHLVSINQSIVESNSERIESNEKNAYEFTLPAKVSIERDKNILFNMNLNFSSNVLLNEVYENAVLKFYQNKISSL